MTEYIGREFDGVFHVLEKNLGEHYEEIIELEWQMSLDEFIDNFVDFDENMQFLGLNI